MGRLCTSHVKVATVGSTVVTPLQSLGPNSTVPTPLKHLQSRFGIAELSGELRLIDLQQMRNVMQGIARSELAFYKRADGTIKMQRQLEVLPVKSDPKTEISQFWKDPGTKVFDSVAFTPLPTSPSTINYWVPPTVNPTAGGSWQIIEAFLLDVICAGDRALNDYLIHFIAHMLQHPEVKPGIIMVLLGGQGTGKGTFFRILHRIWSRTTLQVSDVNQIVGNFNAVLERHYVICMDEALFSGDKKSIERLKSLITEPFIHVEQKYQPSRTIESFHRFFATSNNEFFGQVDADDRRFVFLRVSDSRQTDLAYFDAVHKAIDDDVCMGAMVYDLLNLTLSRFNPRQRPKTPEHLSQRLQSLNGFDRFWYEKLCLGQLPKKHSNDWRGGFVATLEIQEGYRDFDPKSQHHRSLQDDQIAAKLRKYCPSARKIRSNQQGVKQRGYALPTLVVARQEFTAHIGNTIDWDVSELTESPSSDQPALPGPSAVAQ